MGIAAPQEKYDRLSEWCSTATGIVLCGGLSRRMGRSKWELPFGRETVLQRIVGTLRQVMPVVVVVGAPESMRPELPEQVRYIRDDVTAQGPLAGLSNGLRAVPAQSTTVFLTGCDTPLLRAEFIRTVIDQLTPTAMAAAPLHDGMLQPLAAVYRREVIGVVDQLLATGQRSVQSLLRAVETIPISQETLHPADPGLSSLRGMNTVAEYEELLRIFRQESGGHLPDSGTTPA